MTIDKKLDALLDHCGITPGEWWASGHEIGTVPMMLEKVAKICYGLHDKSNARLIAQSRENIKAIIVSALRHFERYGYESPRLVNCIEASLPMTWEEIKKWLEDYDETI